MGYGRSSEVALNRAVQSNIASDVCTPEYIIAKPATNRAPIMPNIRDRPIMNHVSGSSSHRNTNNVPR